MPTIDANQLRSFSTSIFFGLGVPETDAGLVAGLLVEANLTGFDSHGVIRIPRYAKGIKVGAVKPGAEISIVKETLSTAMIDGGWNLGQVVAKYAMNVCIKKAKKNVVGLVTAKNSHHIGRLNAYAEMAQTQDMIGMVSVNSSPSVTPFGGKTGNMGTNPLCFVIPSGETPPMILDMATSVWARGKIMVYLAREKELPSDEIFMDTEGNPTTDPTWYSKGGMLRTLGGDIAGYKGFGLSLLVEILTGVLSEAGVANSDEYNSRPFYGGNGIFMMAIDVGQMTDLNKFKKRVDDLFTSIKNSPKDPGYDEIIIPGDRERRIKKKLLKEGIYVEENTWNDIVSLVKELNIKPPV